GNPSVVMLGTSCQLGDPERDARLCIRAHLTKPVGQSDLFDALCRALEAPAPVRAGTPRRHASEPALVRARVLLAEDNLVNQRVAVGLLTRRGHTVDVVGNGIEALDRMAAANYDVVLMDIQ